MKTPKMSIVDAARETTRLSNEAIEQAFASISPKKDIEFNVLCCPDCMSVSDTMCCNNCGGTFPISPSPKEGIAMEEKRFGFYLGDKVRIKASGERGEVIGRADSINSADTFNVRYKAADGRAVEAWWAEDALEPG